MSIKKQESTKGIENTIIRVNGNPVTYYVLAE
jgi:hypothetical protein